MTPSETPASSTRSDMSSQPFYVGQLLCGGFQGTTVTPQARHLIVDHHVSTLILSKKNSQSVAQITKLIRDLQQIAYTEGNYKYPIMFAIDEEGGMMNSLFDPEYLTQYPSSMALAAAGDTDLVYEIAKAVGLELKTIGFSIILGPVLDVVTKLSHQLVSVRSFGTTIEDVYKYGSMCAKGLQDGGLFTMGKHFPGIGNATVDSLLELPMISDSLEQIKSFNTIPFARLVKEGLLDGISATGCGVPTISPDEAHACLSPVVINQLLRNDIGFDGVVISECLEMDALYHSIGLGQGVILAISAGCDLVMVCHDISLQDEAMDSMQKAITNGNLDEDIILASLARIEKLQKRLPTWEQLFPDGLFEQLSPASSEASPSNATAADSSNTSIKLFKNEYPELWLKHQKLSESAYLKSITLVRDYNDTLPITKFITARSPDDNSPVDNILLLTPLLNPIYKSQPHEHDKNNLYTGEEVFQRFGEKLSNHKLSSSKPYNVLHTTYTANGLTPLHESLIENSKVVIVITSEATRNMYQIGIVKYVSILCGANPNSFNNNAASANYSQLTKPLIVVATSSPYDFFYNKSIGSAYLCCYDYTNNVLTKLADVLLGECEPVGCIPGEAKFIGKSKRKRTQESATFDLTPSSHTSKVARNSVPKRRWLVDELDLNRDWTGVVKLWKNNTMDSDQIIGSKGNRINYQNQAFYRKIYGLLSSTSKTQKHFVVRNSSLNVMYGIVLTWVDVRNCGDSGEYNHGSIMYLLVDKSKRLQSVGKNLHARALRYLIKEKKCKTIALGNSLPLFVFPQNSNFLISESKTAQKEQYDRSNNSKVASFMHNVGWDLPTADKLRKKHIMVLNDLENWSVPKKIFRELMIVGVRFDICNDSEKLMKLIERSATSEKEENPDDTEDRERIRNLYMEAIKYLGNSTAQGVKIIIALEPTNQSVIGSIVLFTNKSQLSKFFPFIDECSNQTTTGRSETPLIGGIIGPVIDPSYSNLTEIFKYGLICSGITFLKSNLNDGDTMMNQCIMVGVHDDKSINGVKDIGFHEWKYYYDYFDMKSSTASAFMKS